MKFISARIITANVNQLVSFYETITGAKAIFYTPSFAELQTGGATLAIGGTDTLQFFGDNSIAAPAQNRSVIIEFKVDDVDSDYERINCLIEPSLIQAPTTMPWGNRSLLFRDPDGNLVNLFTPVTEQAIKKFENA